VSRPVSGLASDRCLGPHLPVRAAQWSIAVPGCSLTVAWAAPALHSFLECSPASRFTLKARVWPPGHLTRDGLYARAVSRASRYATCLCLLLTCTSVPAGTHEWGSLNANGNPNGRLGCGALVVGSITKRTQGIRVSRKSAHGIDNSFVRPLASAAAVGRARGMTGGRACGALKDITPF
jgi:hypothetical protein